MRFPRRRKVLFHAKVDSDICGFKPRASSLRQVRGLWYFRYTQQVRVKVPRRSFTSSGHCELNMVDANDSALTHLAIVTDEDRPFGAQWFFLPNSRRLESHS